jgi:hypothetical protein
MVHLIIILQPPKILVSLHVMRLLKVESNETLILIKFTI